MDVGDNFNGMGNMVEDEQGICQHHYRLRQSHRVVIRRGQLLVIAGQFVAEIAHHAPVEARQSLDDHRPEVLKLLLNKPQGIGGFGVGGADDQRRLGADEAVARQPLAALNAFQQERVAAPGYLEIGRDRRFQVGLDLAVDRYQVALFT